MNKNEPLISIITATFNSENTLFDTISSILNQTYNNIEYVIIDGKSNDKTISIIKNSEKLFKEKNINFRWISESDKGIYDAWNKGLKLCSGEWIIFIGSDDYFKDINVISKIKPYLSIAKSQNCNYVYGKIEHVSGKNELIEISGKPWAEQKKRFLYTMNLPHTGCLHHKSLFEKHGDFNDSFKIVGDYEFLIRELKDPNNSAFFIDLVFAVMREGGVSASLKNRKVIVNENHKARKLNGINFFSKELFFWELRVRIIMILTKIFGENFAAISADYYRKIILKKDKRWSI